ncbi:MAG: DUF4190 domain-containing protein [Verrucomicrobiota bacterium]|nr:DUF4190 domain-containing protein [Verrucomicrobiota bacterium]MDE3066306.1 DUF4190 domain-containing protein [Verrucomicrobiota bacterium]
MYKIIGADGKTYGPATGGQLRQWITEGRANAQTPTLAEGDAAWKPLGAVPEFAGQFPPPVPPTIGPFAARPVRQTNAFAVAGLIFGVLSFLCCCRFLFGPLGLIFSLIGLSQIHEHPERYEGRWLAITGLVLSLISLFLGLVLLMLMLATGHFHYYWHFNRV